MHPSPQDIAVIEARLFLADHWLTAAQLAEQDPHWTDRRLRAVAEISENIISGQLGYRHIKRATPEDIEHSAAWLQSQGSLMLRRAQRIRARAREISEPPTVPCA